MSCAWCKSSYHNKEACFNPQRIGEQCSLGNHSSIIVPPSWIVKLPRKGSFKSSLRKSPKKKAAGKKKSKEKEAKTFIIKPIPTANVHPVLVFINPKSGGNQVCFSFYYVFSLIITLIFIFLFSLFLHLILIIKGSKTFTKVSMAVKSKTSF